MFARQSVKIDGLFAGKKYMVYERKVYGFFGEKWWFTEEIY